MDKKQTLHFICGNDATKPFREMTYGVTSLHVIKAATTRQARNTDELELQKRCGNW